MSRRNKSCMWYLFRCGNQQSLTSVHQGPPLPKFHGPLKWQDPKKARFSEPNPSNGPRNRNGRAQKRLDFSGPIIPMALEMAGPKKVSIFRAQKKFYCQGLTLPMALGLAGLEKARFSGPNPFKGPRNGRAQNRLDFQGPKN
jgi:hypothetical protein